MNRHNFLLLVHCAAAELRDVAERIPNHTGNCKQAAGKFVDSCLKFPYRSVPRPILPIRRRSRLALSLEHAWGEAIFGAIHLQEQHSSQYRVENRGPSMCLNTLPVENMSMNISLAKGKSCSSFRILVDLRAILGSGTTKILFWCV